MSKHLFIFSLDFGDGFCKFLSILPITSPFFSAVIVLLFLFVKGTFKGRVLFYLLRINEFGNSLAFFKIGGFHLYIFWNAFFRNRHSYHLFYFLQMIFFGSVYKRNR